MASFFSAISLLDVVVERADVLDEVFGPLFERKENAGLVVFDRAVVKKGHAEQGLAAAGRAAQQGRPALRKAALSNLVEAANAGWRLAYGGQIARLRARHTGHRNVPPALTLFSGAKRSITQLVLLRRLAETSGDRAR